MTDEARVMSRVALPDETQVERQLRPQRLEEYVGQRAAVESLRVSVEAARRRNEPLDHVLLSGPPGLGKTTLATIMANEMGANIVTTAGPSLERGADLMGILTNLAERDVLFIDEIHRLPRVVEELLYPAMEDFSVNFVMDKGLNARTIRIPLRPFTLVGATTRPGMLSSPLRERFGIFHHLDFYSGEELSAIIRRSASILGAPLVAGGAETIAQRARGTPRIANRLLRRVRDYAQVKADGTVTPALAERALDQEGVDAAGLDRLDRRFLTAIIEQYHGGPVGLEAIAATINDEAETLAEVVEPFLLKIGYVVRSPNGRKATPAAYAHLGHAVPSSPGGQGQLPL
ncbi:MAG TPA: Holliday junction branch migration DNA helicase RuvB [Candidatus Nitrosotalea sp.]|nr:Holliday junction branch migration DNA helicase RuvB [Candidatus Nitrosotalea sp.]